MLLSSFNVFSQISMVKYDKTLNNTKGIVCSLPKKSFIIEINYTERITKPGPYSEFAKDLLGIDNVVKTEKKSFTINKINMIPFTEPDSDEQYVLTSESYSKSEKEAFAIVNNEGIFCGITDNANNLTNIDQLSDISYNFSNEKDNHQSFNTFSAVSSSKTTTDTVMKVNSIDSTFYKSVISNTEDVTIEDKANEAVETIQNLRQQRYDLLSGLQETNYPYKTLKYMDQHLLEMENAYLSLFIGYSIEKQHTYSITYSPIPSDVNKETSILCFSEETGICNSSRNSSSQITALVIPHNEVETKKEETVVTSGIKYRMPSLAEVYIKYKNETYAGGFYKLPQLGKVKSIEILKNKSILLDHETGTINKISL